jgi:UDP-galactopyranose mutase
MIPPSPSDFSRHVPTFSEARRVTHPDSAVAHVLPDLVCLSHLRWNFVFQRPQHLMTRAARERRVFFVEEPLFDASTSGAWVDVLQPSKNLYVIVPHLLPGVDENSTHLYQRRLLDELLNGFDVSHFVLWYWTPMALGFTRHLRPAATVFDCMDELSGFAGAPPTLKRLERELVDRADVMFTGGVSLYEAKQSLHANVHALPSSVDVAHFARALDETIDPQDQCAIPRPRAGYFGVIDERMDLPLVDAVAALRPEWQLVFLGPTAKIDPASLPARENIHYLGMKTYEELPQYLAGWDVAMLPFARNDATRFISPTKTPEYLAAGRPVVSTSIRDVVRPYGELGLVHIADAPEAFAAAIDTAMRDDRDRRLARVRAFLQGNSWDATWARMSALIAAACDGTAAPVSTRVAHV